MQEARYAWMEDEPPVVAIQAQAASRGPVPPAVHSESSLNQLEGPRSSNKVEEPTSWRETPPPAAYTPAPSHHSAPQPIAAAATAPPPFWDSDDLSTPAPSIRPEDLKFWPGTSPAELRRIAREQAARENPS